ncbi:MAG: pentapeptide repeat-containing protein [Bacilli bacterium]|nr:pentapeptide repeat-containing protein [Bacilli bacterium]
MREITEKELEEILEKHADWLNRRGGERADLSNTNLRKAYLIGTNLSGADLSGANLSNAILRGADLNNVNLINAILRGADLRDSILFMVDFRGADLSNANLRGADLSGANLRYANLNRANLNRADLSRVSANESTAFYHLQCPEIGAFTGFKKCIAVVAEKQEFVIVELLIPKDAKRSSATTRKCRCDKALVVGFYDLAGNKLDDIKLARSLFDYNFAYEIDKTVEVSDFNENRWIECAEGIHFFMSFKEAVNFNLP